MDESWFYLMEDGASLLLVPEIEVAANPKITHKSHVEKIMFLSVLAKPRMLDDGTWFIV